MLAAAMHQTEQGCARHPPEPCLSNLTGWSLSSRQGRAALLPTGGQLTLQRLPDT